MLAAGMMATSAFAQELVYELDYSNESKFPFYVMGYEPEIIDGVLTSNNPGGWYQYFIADHILTTVGESYTAVVTCKASEDLTCALNCGWGWGEGEAINNQIKMTTEWTEASVVFEEVGGTSCNLVLQPGGSTATIEIKSVKVYQNEKYEYDWVSVITNGVAADGESANLISRIPGKEEDAPVVDNPFGEGVVFESPIAADPEFSWDSQFFITFNDAIAEGEMIEVSFDYACSDERSIDTQAHGAPGEYHHWDFLGSLKAKPEWQSFYKKVTITGDQAGADGVKTIAFNLATSPEAATFYINNVVVNKRVLKGSAVESVTIVPSSNCVYNFQGVKVANSLDEVTVPGLYITNGKKVIKK